MRIASLLLFAVFSAPAGAQTVAEDPYLWLEGVEDSKALDWVRRTWMVGGIAKQLMKCSLDYLQ